MDSDEHSEREAQTTWADEAQRILKYEGKKNISKRKQLRDRYEQKLEIKPPHFAKKRSNAKSFNSKAEEFKSLN